MPEVDTPGHAASFCAGHPEVCPSASCLEPLNPATEATFDLLRGLFSDITGGSRGSGKQHPSSACHGVPERRGRKRRVVGLVRRFHGRAQHVALVRQP